MNANKFQKMIQVIEPFLHDHMYIRDIPIMYHSAYGTRYLLKTSATISDFQLKFIVISFDYKNIWKKWNGYSKSNAKFLNSIKILDPSTDEFLEIVIRLMIHEVWHVKQICDMYDTYHTFDVSDKHIKLLEDDAVEMEESCFKSWGNEIIKLLREGDLI